MCRQLAIRDQATYIDSCLNNYSSQLKSWTKGRNITQILVKNKKVGLSFLVPTTTCYRIWGELELQLSCLKQSGACRDTDDSEFIVNKTNCKSKILGETQRRRLHKDKRVSSPRSLAIITHMYQI